MHLYVFSNGIQNVSYWNVIFARDTIIILNYYLGLVGHSDSSIKSYDYNIILKDSQSRYYVEITILTTDDDF